MPRVRFACTFTVLVALAAPALAVVPAPAQEAKARPPGAGASRTPENPPAVRPDGAPLVTPEAAVDTPSPVVSLQTIHGALELPASQLGELQCDPELSKCALPAQTVPVEELLFVRFPWSERALEPRSVRLLLRTGDTLIGRVEGGGDEENLSLRVASLGNTLLTVPLADVKGWLRTQPRVAGRDEPMRAALEGRLERRLRQDTPTDDIFVLTEGGEIRGLLETIGLAGVRVSSETLGDSNNEDSGIEIPFEKLRAVLLTQVDLPDDAGPASDDIADPAGTKAARPQARLRLRDGSRLLVRVEGLGAGQFRGQHARLGTIELALDEILDIAFLSGRARYLSDLEPLAADERLGPAFLLRRPFRRDANVLGGPLRLGQRDFEKGLGVHAYSRLQFQLGGQFDRFQAVIGLDATAHPRDPEVARSDVASVVFRVHVDDEVTFEKAMTWRDEPLQLELPIAGRQVLTLEVDYGGPPGSTNFALDRADWADARVIKSRT